MKCKTCGDEFYKGYPEEVNCYACNKKHLEALEAALLDLRTFHQTIGSTLENASKRSMRDEDSGSEKLRAQDLDAWRRFCAVAFK